MYIGIVIKPNVLSFCGIEYTRGYCKLQFNLKYTIVSSTKVSSN